MFCAAECVGLNGRSRSPKVVDSGTNFRNCFPKNCILVTIWVYISVTGRRTDNSTALMANIHIYDPDASRADVVGVDWSLRTHKNGVQRLNIMGLKLRL